ncbi:UNVERIFIED_CONTAM: hypothetical protein PYX00_001827 [Menopon gallinae]|uniref:CUB domain-containing protein n=1 Tax=Menopon gallinae TaxID=328185 RepID=A0AAW2IFP3_9NEOP
MVFNRGPYIYSIVYNLSASLNVFPVLVGRINGRNTLCNATRNGEQVEGVCLPARECVNAGGVKSGGCSILGTCCIIEKTCTNVTAVKLSYFVSPRTFQENCPLTVKPMNKDVCQLRLDFLEFSIAQPTQPVEESASNKSFQCLHDYFIVGSRGNLGFKHLCGENAKQHIYIPVTDRKDVVLHFGLARERNSNVQLVTPRWKIKIRQLECARYQATDLNHIQSSLTSMHQQHHHHHRPNYNSDYELIAPDDCLQYYPKETGKYETFNYNAGYGPYIGMTKYAICFRKRPNYCGIRHTAESFTMSYNVNNTIIYCHPQEEASENTSQDSLQIPGALFNSTRTDYFCDSQLNSSVSVSAYVPGPLQVIVRTDGFRVKERLETGFRVNYELLNAPCPL